MRNVFMTQAIWIGIVGVGMLILPPRPQADDTPTVAEASVSAASEGAFDPAEAAREGRDALANAVTPDEIEAALDLLRRSAEAGNSSAMDRLGAAYLQGRKGMAPEPDTARAWLDRAVDANHGYAPVRLGLALIRGTGLEVNVAEGMAVLEKAADAGNAAAMDAIGNLYLGGAEGIAADPLAAENWLGRAIASGNESARARLGNALVHGIGLDRDPARGFPMLQQAAAAGEPDAMDGLGRLYLSGAEGIPADPAKAREWLDRAVAEGHPYAPVRLGNALLRGDGLPADLQAGLALLQDAAAEGQPDAMDGLGRLYLTGAEGVPADPEKAREWLRKATDAGQPYAPVRLGRALTFGEALPADPEVGRALLEQAAAGGQADAYDLLGRSYLEGSGGVARDKEEGRRYLRQAVTLGKSYAPVRLAMSYIAEPGAGEADLREGLEVLRQAAESGNVYAASRLIGLYRSGRGQLLSSDPAEARRLVGEFEDVLGQGVQRETLLLDAININNNAGYERLFEQAEEIPLDLRQDLVQTLFWINPNTAVYFVQRKLADATIYGGPINGLATRSTIRAISAACRSPEFSIPCATNPITAETLDAVYRSL